MKLDRPIIDVKLAQGLTRSGPDFVVGDAMLLQERENGFVAMRGVVERASVLGVTPARVDDDAVTGLAEAAGGSCGARDWPTYLRPRGLREAPIEVESDGRLVAESGLFGGRVHGEKGTTRVRQGRM